MPENNRIKIVWAAMTDLPSGWFIREHKHDYYHLFYVVSGKGNMIINRTPYPITPGNLYIIPPGTLHEIPAEGYLMVLYEVKFFVNDAHIRSALEKAGMFVESAPKFYETLLHFIWLNWMSNEPETLGDLDGFLSTLILSLNVSKEKITHSYYIITDGYSVLTQSIIAYIEQNHTEQFRIKDLEAETGYNANYLCSVFKKDTGITMIDYLNHVRVRHATSCFFYGNASGVSVNDVCQYVGFTNPSHFNRVFKKLTGIAPGKFRRLYSGMGSEMISPGNTPEGELSKLYDDTLGIKLLSLEDAIIRLKHLGSAAAAHTETKE